MLEKYTPNRLCRDYAEPNFPDLLSFIAVVKGVKPVMSNFIRYNRYRELEKMCNKYGVFVTHNNYFLEVPTRSYLKEAGKDSKQKIVNYITEHSTTKWIAFPNDDPRKNRFVQVFISKSKNLANDALKFGWTTTVVGNHFVQFDLIDMLNFGKLLGYPDCCVEFFCNRLMDVEIGARKPYIIYRNTVGEPSFYCNNILAYFSNYSLISHFPCSFNCKNTIKKSKELLDIIKEEEPEYAKKIEHHLKLPLLVFRDKRAIVFDGVIKNGEIIYSDCIFLGLKHALDESEIYKFETFKEGDSLKVVKDEILIFKNDELLHSIKREDESFGFPLKFH